MKLKPLTTALAAAAIGVGIAACGASSAPGVVTAPGAGLTSAPTAKASTTPSSTSTTASSTVKTPTSGPLSKEPSFSVPSGPAPTKLEIKTLIAGTGPAAAKGDELTVNYVGKLYKTGKTFDSSWKDNQTFGPFQLGAGAVIAGWDQGLVGLKQGGRYELTIPPSLAYKNEAKKKSGLPPGSTLVFVIDILKVSK